MPHNKFTSIRFGFCPNNVPNKHEKAVQQIFGEKLNVVGSKTSSPSLESLERNACVNDLQEACQTSTLKNNIFLFRKKESLENILLTRLENWCTLALFSFYGHFWERSVNIVRRFVDTCFCVVTNIVPELYTVKIKCLFTSIN